MALNLDKRSSVHIRRAISQLVPTVFKSGPTYVKHIIDVYNLAEISTLGLVVYVHSSGNNSERSISASDPITYVLLFDNISGYLLLRRSKSRLRS